MFQLMILHNDVELIFLFFGGQYLEGQLKVSHQIDQVWNTNKRLFITITYLSILFK